MKEQNNNFVHKLMLMYLTWFGAGRAKKAPGTVGTLAALPFIYAWSELNTQLWVDLSVISALTFLACIIAEKVQQKLKLQDPQWIVVDEVLGMALTWAIARPQSALEWGLCFIAFRFFDIVKVWPASYLDKSVKNGAGTILDDTVSGIFAGTIVLLIGNYFLRY